MYVPTIKIQLTETKVLFQSISSFYKSYFILCINILTIIIDVFDLYAWLI